jgi:hypothetical protein
MDCNVVHVDGKPTFGNLFVKDGIHHGLECGGRVGETKEHNCRLKEAFMGEKGGFPFVAGFDANVVITPLNIKGGKQSASTKVVDDLRDERGYVAIMDGPLVDWSIILDGAELAIFFSDKEEVGGISADGSSNGFSCEMFFHKVTHSLNFVLC